MIDLSKVVGVTNTDLPEGYTLLRYIESTGTQYIDTGLSLPYGWRIKGKILLPSGLKKHNGIFGTEGQVGSTWARNCFKVIGGNVYTWYIGFGDYKTTNDNPRENNEYEFDACNIIGETPYIKIGGRVLSLVNGGEVDTGIRYPASCYLFAINGQDDNAQDFGTYRHIGEWEVYDENHTLVRVFVPCINPSGEVGLYDKVSGQFYGNAGSGEFAASAPRTRVVTKIECNGAVLWAAKNGGESGESSDTVTLEVEKITADTYSSGGELTERFIVLDIYPKPYGTVSVTYGGLTKTVTDTSGAVEPNAQSVHFGTLYNIRDSVDTPESGTLTIEGEYRAFGCGSYQSSKVLSSYYTGITAINSMGTVEFVPDKAFGSVLSGGCQKIQKAIIPNGITSIGEEAFNACSGLSSFNIPQSITSIGVRAFGRCDGLKSVTFSNPTGWWVSTSADATSGDAVDVTDPANNVSLITSTYANYYWYRTEEV